MRVYVETNFVLEIALLQTEHICCNEIFDLASSSKIELVVPAYSLVEPHETLSRRHSERLMMKDFVDKEFKLLARSENYREQLANHKSITDILTKSRFEEAKRLHDTQKSMIKTATILPLDSCIVSAAHECEQEYGLKPQDSTVLASILLHLQKSSQTSSCFINRNAKDFEDPDIVKKLDNFNCKLISNFTDGIKFIRHKLGTLQK